MSHSSDSILESADAHSDQSQPGSTLVEQDPSVQTVAFVSLGCPKNLVDSEKMLGSLAEAGIMPVADESEADAIVINTCGFLEASKAESLGEIERAMEQKRAGKCQRVVVAGCLVQRHRAKMLEWAPGVDALIGVFDRDRVVEAVTGRRADRAASAGEGKLPVYSSIAGNATVAWQQRHADEAQGEAANTVQLQVKGKGYYEDDSARLRLTPRHYAYLRVSEGCNQNCAFCTIPSIRGKMRSKPVDRIIAEAKELMDDGAFELNLIGQDTTSFGDDIGYGPGLAGMLTELDNAVAAHAGVKTAQPAAWLRLMYAYPSCFTDEMIDAIASLPHVLKYIDMPLQHINDQVLDNMRRKTSRKLIETLLEKLRDRVDGIAIRTTFISGFPGETDEQHQELVKFVQDFGFDAMGVFPYSPEPGTPAGRMYEQGGAIPEDVVTARVEELMLAQQDFVFDNNRALAEYGWEIDILIDAPTATEGEATTGVGQGGKLYEGRGYHQAPGIDGLTYVQSKQTLSPGELVRCKVVDADGYDLIARPLVDLENKVSLPLA